MDRYLSAFKNVSVVLLLLIGLVTAIGSQMGRTYRLESITNFTQKTVLHSSSQSGHVSMVELIFATALDKPVTIKMLDNNDRIHYEYELPANGFKKIEVDWYTTEVKIVLSDAGSLNGTIDVEYFF